MSSATVKSDKKQLKYDRILKSAAALITRDGLANLSMNALAKEAEVAKGTLYLYFEHKEAVLAALTIKARLKLLEGFENAAAAADHHLDKLRNIMRVAHRFPTAEPPYGELMSYYELNSDLEETAELIACSHGISNFVQSILDEAKAVGQIRADVNTAAVTFLMWGICNGLNQMIDIRGEQIEATTGHRGNTFFDDAVELFLRGLR